MLFGSREQVYRVQAGFYDCSLLLSIFDKRVTEYWQGLSEIE